MLCRPASGPAPANHGPSPASAPDPSRGVPLAHLENLPLGKSSPGTASGNSGGPAGPLRGQKPVSMAADSWPLIVVTPPSSEGSVVPSGQGTLMLLSRTSRSAPTKRYAAFTAMP